MERLLGDELHLVRRRGQFQPCRMTAEGSVDGRRPPVHEGWSPCDIGERGTARASLSKLTPLVRGSSKRFG